MENFHQAPDAVLEGVVGLPKKGEHRREKSGPIN
jgi:hypothetical protein